MGHLDLATFDQWAINWKEAGGVIYYDIDDDLLNAEELALRINTSVEIAAKRTDRIKSLAKHADAVTVSMPSLVPLLEPFVAHDLQLSFSQYPELFIFLAACLPKKSNKI
jgi:hypothetical protein